MQAPRYGHSPYRTQPLARDQPNATASITTEPELTQQRTPTELDTTVPRSSTFNPVLQDSQTCWICLDSDDDFEALQGGNYPAREWVHACNCTLVAHSDCLLAWYSADVANKQAPPCCPVCATPYLIKEDTSQWLRTYKQLVRRWDKASTIIALGGVAGGAWLVAAAYGAYAVKAFAGERVAKALLLKHDKFPIKYWLNLPLIPLTLILSRTPLIDSLLPFLPLTLVLSTSSHPPPYPFVDSDPLGLSNLSFSWPPSPTLTLCLLPWARLFYLKARRRVFDLVLGRRTNLEGFAGLMETMRAADEGDFEAGVGQGRFEVVAEVELEEIHEHGDDAHEHEHGHDHDHGVDHQPEDGAEILDGGREDGRAEARAQMQGPAAQARPPRAVANNRLRVGLSRITSLLVGALLYPTLCSLAGSALFFLASRQGARPSAPIRLLRRILGVQAVLAAAATTKRSTTNSFALSIVSWLRLLSPTSTTASSTAAATGPIVDPVWVRNFLGGGLVLVARDALELGAGVLERRRKMSRRIVGRAFDDGLELDDSVRDSVNRGVAAAGDPASATTTASRQSPWDGGVNAQGRAAVVHNLL